MVPPFFAGISQYLPHRVIKPLAAVTCTAPADPTDTKKYVQTAAPECIQTNVFCRLTPADGSLSESHMPYLFPSLLLTVVIIRGPSLFVNIKHRLPPEIKSPGRSVHCRSGRNIVVFTVF